MVQSAVKPLTASQARLWLTENGASPANAPEYKGFARVTNPTVSRGSTTQIRIPDPNRYGSFLTVGTVRGVPDPGSVNIESRRELGTVSELLRIFNKQCAVDVQVHFGDCQDPQNFSDGWDTVRIFEDVEPQQWSGSDHGAFDEGNDGALTETLGVNFARVYDVKKLRAAEVASSDLTDEAVDVIIADQVTCGQCGRVSDGCQIAFILVGDTSGSPGLPPKVLFTEDGGSTWSSSVITTLGLAESPLRLAAVGTDLVVVSNDSGSLHYANINDILDGTESWSEVATGFDGSGAPNAISSVARDRTWIAGDGGRIYLTTDPGSGVTEQADGSQTAQNLLDIHALDRNNVVAVGESNAVLVTANGGSTWAAVTGPAPGVNIRTVWMLSVNDWIVGLNDGTLYYTRNAGTTWTAKSFPGSGAGTVRHVRFASKNVGYMAHVTAAAAGRILRTIDGGNSWVVLPEEAGQTIPANDAINRVAPCPDDPNICFGVGLAADASDGFAVKFS